MTTVQRCAVCGRSGFWVGWVKDLGENRCLAHLPRDGSTMHAEIHPDDYTSADG